MKKIFLTLALVALYLPASAAVIDIWEGTNCRTAPGGCGFSDALTVTKNIINVLMQFALIGGTFMIVYGGALILLSGGSEEMYNKGKSTLKWAVVGIAIALSAWIIVNTIIRLLAGIGGASASPIPWSNIVFI